jgi:hypothetical protein
MRTIYIIGNADSGACRHFGKEDAERAVERIYYTDKEGKRHEGAHWSLQEVEELTAGTDFKECVTAYDKWVAYNAAYADLCKAFGEEDIIAAATAFFFEDEDAPCGKIWLYMQSF